MIEVLEYQDQKGKSPFTGWFNRLDAKSAAKVTVALKRMGMGNLSNAKSVGGGVFECRLHIGPGYRIYFGKDGDALVVLLRGGTKKRQQADIDKARNLWSEYRQRKKADEEGRLLRRR